jgi:hypothetical protein
MRQSVMSLILYLYIALAIILAGVSIYFASKNKEFVKFLAGAFFVSSGMMIYFYFAKVFVPLLGTNFIETPEISLTRGIVHFLLFATCLYYGFFKKEKEKIE